jgi:biotin transporter BioY
MLPYLVCLGAGFIVGFVTAAIPFGLLVHRSTAQTDEAIRLIRVSKRPEPEPRVWN